MVHTSHCQERRHSVAESHEIHRCDIQARRVGLTPAPQMGAQRLLVTVALYVRPIMLIVSSTKCPSHNLPRLAPVLPRGNYDRGGDSIAI